MPNINKPILTVKEQVKHLKEKGVLFNIMSEAEAEQYLINQSNYFKVTAYRKNYAKHPAGVNEGKYIHLEFAYIVDLATIDMYLRYQIVLMALDIEHHAKLQLLHEIESHGEDGYSIVDDFTKSLDRQQLKIFKDEISRNNKNVYCGDIVHKYKGHFPAWALLEIIPFGRLVSFYRFCALRYNDETMLHNFFLLLTCKNIRNASAHSNCILNDLRAKTTSRRTDTAVMNALSSVNEISVGYCKNRMSNARIQEIVTLFYTYRTMVVSDALREHGSLGIRAVSSRMNEHKEYYKDNQIVSGTFSFLETLIDKWF